MTRLALAAFLLAAAALMLTVAWPSGTPRTVLRDRPGQSCSLARRDGRAVEVCVPGFTGR